MEQAVLWQPSLTVQAAIGRNPATRKMSAARSSKAAAPPLQDAPSKPTAPPLQDPPAATVVSNAAGDASRFRTVDDLGNTSSHRGSLCDELKDNETIQIMIHEAVEKAITRACNSPNRGSELRSLINDSVKKGVLSSQPSNSSMSRVDRMKLVRETLSEHQTFSRVLYVLALGTPVTPLIARAVRRESSHADKNMIRNTGLEMGFSFLAVSVCHLYIILFHFVRTEGPKVSMWLMRLIILFLCVLVSAWMLIYTFHMPQNLFRTNFWWITGSFLVLNWFLSAILGCTGLLREGWMVDIG